MKTKPYTRPASLLSVEADAKTTKGSSFGVLTGILYLAPSTVAGVGDMCSHASDACRVACLNLAGRGAFSNVQKARVNKTRFLFDDREGFAAMLRRDIARVVRIAKARGMRPAVRLNGTSDLPWESLFPGLMEEFPEVTFYDYSKVFRRVVAFKQGKLPANYHLTFSLSESNAAQAALALGLGVNVAAVAEGYAAGDRVPVGGLLWESFDADASDLRFLDGPDGQGRGRVGLLKAKGPARRDRTGFVIRRDGKGAA